MKFNLYSRVALAEDLPERRLRRGDVVTVVAHHAGGEGRLRRGEGAWGGRPREREETLQRETGTGVRH